MTLLAQRIKRLGSSPIRDILHALDNPELVSFAGGLPSPTSFPDMSTGADDLRPLLQYGASEGERDLREAIAEELLGYGVPAHPDRVLVLSGSQQGIDLVAKLMIDTGTRVGIQSPTYLAALQVFSLFGADYVPLMLDDSQTCFEGQDPALLYVNPTFQNPTGNCLTLAERAGVAALCDRTRTVLFEDDPYRELMYSPCDRTPVCSLVDSVDWVYQSSFSKTIAPGLRLGFLVCSEALYPHLLALKQAADLHTNRVAQLMVLQQIRLASSGDRIKLIRDDYRSKRDMFDALLRETMGDLAHWSTPEGGLFFWLTLKDDQTVDTRALLARALRENVAFMPGESFFPPGFEAGSHLRLNFSHASVDQAKTGLRVLARLLREML